MLALFAFQGRLRVVCQNAHLNESESLHAEAHRVVDLGLPGVVKHTSLVDRDRDNSNTRKLHDVRQYLHVLKLYLCILQSSCTWSSTSSMVECRSCACQEQTATEETSEGLIELNVSALWSCNQSAGTLVIKSVYHQDSDRRQYGPMQRTLFT